ncbi:protein trunk isoform X2 [Leptinotarsa decemlineata]|nr:protein trunk isoform X2 [Leptinotarsa decemlineata]XP_023029929.1 protein trunk isoform X2 [Leptinotarsa decemlineata]
MVLEETLGAAYNPRYMSIDEPAKTVTSSDNRKRTTKEVLDFYVDQDFSETIEDGPAWMIKNHVGLTMGGFSHKRYKRGINYKQEWQCLSEVKWIDLGLDYFPRYLRTVECLTKKCWFGMYQCKPRSFTVKILKRRKNRCVAAAPGTIVGVRGLPISLKELWVWEERAVNFCCDCSM